MANRDVTNNDLELAGEESRVTTLELFFDLVFVFTLTQLTALLAEIVSSLIDTSVGVAEGRTAVCGTGVSVAVGGRDVTAGGEVVEVDKTSTENVQASSSSAFNRKTIIAGNHLRGFIAFSLFALANRIESAGYPSPHGNPSLEFQLANDYKTFAPGFLFHG